MRDRCNLLWALIGTAIGLYIGRPGFVSWSGQEFDKGGDPWIAADGRIARENNPAGLLSKLIHANLICALGVRGFDQIPALSGKVPSGSSEAGTVGFRFRNFFHPLSSNH